MKPSAIILAGALFYSAYDPNILNQGGICFANADLLTQSTYRESLTQYAVGWKNPDSHQELIDFIAPPVEVARRFNYKALAAGEALVADPDEDSVGTDGNFKRVTSTSSEIDARTGLRGLTKRILDEDRVGDYLQMATSELIGRLDRNTLARLKALVLAAATPTSINWGVSNTSRSPDANLSDLFLASGEDSGLNPNRILLSRDNWALRTNAYRATNTPYAGAAAAMTPEALAATLGLAPGGLRISDERIQLKADSGAKKQVMGTLIIAFNAQINLSKDDPSSFKRFYSRNKQGGQRYAVFVTEGPMFTDVTVCKYEKLSQTATSGSKSLTITNT